jgi:hypothetical protein
MTAPGHHNRCRPLPERARTGPEALPVADVSRELEIEVLRPSGSTGDQEDRPALAGSGSETTGVSRTAVPGRAEYDQVQGIEEHRHDPRPAGSRIGDEGETTEVHSHTRDGLEP